MATLRPFPRVMDGPFSSEEDTTYDAPGVSFGADAAIDQQRRQLVLAGLQTAMQEQTRAQEPDFLKQQRANIAGHGTIETGPDFAHRTGQRDAAELLDPANPMGRLRSDDQANKMAQIHESNVVPSEINAGVQREKIASDFDASVLGADSEAGAKRYAADSAAQSDLEAELANAMLDPKFAGARPADREAAIAAFLKSINDPALRQHFRHAGVPAGVGR